MLNFFVRIAFGDIRSRNGCAHMSDQDFFRLTSLVNI